MLCPQCKVSLAFTKRLSVETNDCPQCRGIWLEQNVLEKILAHTQSSSDKQATLNKDNIQYQAEPKSLHIKKKHPNFLSGAFDISDDW
ncbi:MAG: zf-TFIIB domain-containing protein [Colwellia sp.]|nr:zf-TFIIB domain-containing protein [Colwellia sp.]